MQFNPFSAEKITVRNFLILLLIISTNLFAEIDRDISFIYQQKIDELMDQNWFTEADSLLKKAMEYDQHNSGLWLLKARMDIESLQYEEALAANLQALQIDDWQKSSFRESAVLQCRLLYRMKKYGDLLDFYYSLPETLMLDRELLFYRTYSELRMGQLDEAVEASERGMVLYPEDVRFFGPGMIAGKMDLLTSFEKQWGENKDVLDQWLTPLVRQFPDSSLQDLFYRIDIDNPYKSYLTGKWWNTEELRLFFEKYPRMDDLKILEQLYLQTDESGRNILEDFISGQNRSFFYDSNYDGMAEGSLIPNNDGWTYRLDMDQNGISDRDINLNLQGIPLTLMEHQGAKELRFHYDQWPFISRVESLESWERRVYQLAYGDAKSSLPGKMNLIAACRWLNEQGESWQEQELLSLSQRIDKYNHDDVLFRRYFLQGGNIFLIREDSDMNGNPDRLLWVNQWHPMEGLRDLDEDGTADLYEYYHNGVWEGVMLDSQKDGVGDYIESWDPCEILLWDYNQDSLWDSIFNKESNRVIIVPQELGQISKEDTHFWDFNYDKYWFQ